MRALRAVALAGTLACSAASVALAQESTATGRCAEQEEHRSGDPWALLSSMAGHVYWFNAANLKPRSAYLVVHWVTEGQVLATSVHNAKHVLEAEEDVLDPATGKLLVAGNDGNINYWGVAHASGACAASYIYFKDKPIRTLLSPEPGGSFMLHGDSYKDGSWQSDGDTELVATTLEELRAAGLVKGR